MSRDADPAYPTVTPSDPEYACQTREPLAPPLGDVATPGVWGRLAEPLRRSMLEIWHTLGLRETGLPAVWVSLHYGRIALNAHGWERLRARVDGREGDPALLEPSHGLGRWLTHRERRRARRRRPRLEERFSQAEQTRCAHLRRVEGVDPSGLDAAELARGPLDDVCWSEILLPALALPLLSGEATEEDGAVEAGLALERRYAGELGRRLVLRGVLARPAQVAYLTVDERIRAVHDEGADWAELAEERSDRVKQFACIEVPLVFWGRPRIEREGLAAEL